MPPVRHHKGMKKPDEEDHEKFGNIEAGNMFCFCGDVWIKKRDGIAAPLKSGEKEMLEEYKFEPQTRVEGVSESVKAEAERAYLEVIERKTKGLKLEKVVSRHVVPEKKKSPALESADEEKQMLLFSPFFDKIHNRTFPLADTINRYVLTKRRYLKTAKGSTKTYQSKDGRSTVTAAIFDEKIILPGALEQLIELVLRKLTIEQNAEMGLWQEKKKQGIHHVSVMFSLAELRRRLAANGSERKSTEIREALQVMSRCHWAVQTTLTTRFVGELSGPILRIEATQKEKRADARGEREMYLAYWHPLIAEAILSSDHYLLDNGILKLKDPLARWILNRLNARYRQAGKGDAIAGHGYTLSLDTILAESGIEAESRFRNTVDRVRSAIDELKEHFFLSPVRPYDEKPTYEVTATKPKVIGMTWELFPSSSFAQSVIEGNREARLRPPSGTIGHEGGIGANSNSTRGE